MYLPFLICCVWSFSLLSAEGPAPKKARDTTFGISKSHPAEVPSLLDRAAQSIITQFPLHSKNLIALPTDLRERLGNLMILYIKNNFDEPHEGVFDLITHHRDTRCYFNKSGKIVACISDDNSRVQLHRRIDLLQNEFTPTKKKISNSGQFYFDVRNKLYLIERNMLQKYTIHKDGKMGKKSIAHPIIPPIPKRLLSIACIVSQGLITLSQKKKTGIERINLIDETGNSRIIHHAESKKVYSSRRK